VAANRPKPSMTLPCWARPSADGRGLTLSVHVQPGARTTGPAGRHGDALKLRIAAPANDNRANEALTDFLQDALALPRLAVRIVHGARSRHKLIAVDAFSEALAKRLREWDVGQTRA